MNLYAIILKETKQLITADNIKAIWKNYGSNSLYGWRPPKKVYEKIGQAKRGFAFIPEELKEHCEIAKLTIEEIVIDGADLGKEQKIAKEKREKQKEQRDQKWKIERAKAELELAQKRLNELNEN